MAWPPVKRLLAIASPMSMIERASTKFLIAP